MIERMISTRSTESAPWSFRDLSPRDGFHRQIREYRRDGFPHDARDRLLSNSEDGIIRPPRNDMLGADRDHRVVSQSSSTMLKTSCPGSPTFRHDRSVILRTGIDVGIAQVTSLWSSTTR